MVGYHSGLLNRRPGSNPGTSPSKNHHILHMLQNLYAKFPRCSHIWHVCGILVHHEKAHVLGRKLVINVGSGAESTTSKRARRQARADSNGELREYSIAW